MFELVPQAQQVLFEVNKAILGKSDEIKEIMTAFLANGHVLLEDIPGDPKHPEVIGILGSTDAAVGASDDQCKSATRNSLQRSSSLRPTTTSFFFASILTT